MKKIIKLLKSPHIQIALTTGVCIVLLAYVSKRILTEQMSNLLLAIPPFIASVYEVLLNKHENKGLLRTIYWITAIFFATAMVILVQFL